MAVCSLNKNVLRTSSCGYSLPTVTDLYLANYSDITKAEYSTNEQGCEEITGFTPSGITFYHIEPNKDSTTFSDELQVGDSGNKYRTHSITFSISGQFDACQHGVLDALSLGRFFVVIKTAEGNYLALGRNTGLEAETATLNGGSESNGIEVTLSNNVAESAMPLSEEAATFMLAHIAQD